MDILATETDIRSDATELADIIMILQRCFLLNISKELARGNVSFPQYFLLGYLEQRETATMTEIAQKMGHTTAAATGLVDRLENLGYVARSHATEDRRKVIVRIQPKGSLIVERVREDMVGNIMKVMTHLTHDEQKTWLKIYQIIHNYCQGT